MPKKKTSIKKKPVSKKATKAKPKVVKKVTVKKVTKKTAKKAATKKATKKSIKIIKKTPRTSVKIAKKVPRRKLTMTVAPDKVFWIYQGPIVSSLIELRDILPGLRQEQFEHHVNEGKNDFSLWIEFVLSEPALAKLLRDKINKSKFLKTLDNYFK